MGWSFGWDMKQRLLAERVSGAETPTRRQVCVAHCYRGGRFSGILWTVWSITDKATGAEDRYIGCDLFRYRRGDGWGYKDMEELSHPFYYSCPLKYLALVPEGKFKTCDEWRKGVMEYHARRTRKLEVGRTYGTAENIKVMGVSVDSLIVRSVRPLRCDARLMSGSVVGNVRPKRRHFGELR